MNALRRAFPETAIPPPADRLPPQRLHLVRPSHDLPLEIVDRFATGRASQKERQAVMRHLLAGCPQCQMRLQGHWGGAAPAAETYDEALHRSRERCLAY